MRARRKPVFHRRVNINVVDLTTIAAVATLLPHHSEWPPVLNASTSDVFRIRFLFDLVELSRSREGVRPRRL